jgi:hypothetical protein
MEGIRLVAMVVLKSCGSRAAGRDSMLKTLLMRRIIRVLPWLPRVRGRSPRCNGSRLRDMVAIRLQ